MKKIIIIIIALVGFITMSCGTQSESESPSNFDCDCGNRTHQCQHVDENTIKNYNDRDWGESNREDFGYWSEK